MKTIDNQLTRACNDALEGINRTLGHGAPLAEDEWRLVLHVAATLLIQAALNVGADDASFLELTEQIKQLFHEALPLKRGKSHGGSQSDGF